MILGLQAADWAAIIFYLVGVTVIGVWTVKRVHDTSDFFMGGRSFGKWFMVFFAFGAGTSGNDAVGVSSKTYTNGLSGIWWQWLWLFCTPFYWLIAPVLRRMRALTTGDYFEHRYDASVGGLYTIVGIAQLTVNIGIIQLGAGSMIEAATGGAIPKFWAIAIMTVLFVTYGMAGGLSAAIITDFIQGILTVILSFILLPFALNAVGGFKGLREGIADEHMFSLVAPGEINLFFIVMLAVSALIGIVTQPHIMGVCAAGRTEYEGRFGFAVGNLIKRFCTVAWTVVGLCAVVMYVGTDIKPDMVYGQVASDLLPKIMPGLVGVFIAALIASVMSSCDAFMVSCSGLFTQNLYRRWFVTAADEKHYVWVGRVVSLFIVAAGFFFAFAFTDVPTGLIWFFKVQALMGAAFWIGLFWRRATVAGAWAGTIIGFVILLATSSIGFISWAAGATYTVRTEIKQIVSNNNIKSIADIQKKIDEIPTTLGGIAEYHNITFNQMKTWSSGEWNNIYWDEATPDTFLSLDTKLTVTKPALPSFMIYEHKFRESWQIFFYLSAGFLSCILVSLFTPRVPKERLDRIYAALRTPVQPDEKHDPIPFSLPEGVVVPEENKLFNHPDFEIPMPNRESLVGFGILWLCVGGLIAFVYWMATWGA